MLLFPGLFSRRKHSNSKPNPNAEQSCLQQGDLTARKTSEYQHNSTPPETPAFEPTDQEKIRRDLEKIRLDYNTESLSFEPVKVGPRKSYIIGIPIGFSGNVANAAKHGSRVARFRLNPKREKLRNLITSQKERDEACAVIYRECGIPPERVTFGMATRVTHEGAIQLQLWMDIDFG